MKEKLKKKAKVYIQIPAEEYEDVRNKLSGLFILIESLMDTMETHGTPHSLCNAKELISENASFIVRKMNEYSTK